MLHAIQTRLEKQAQQAPQARARLDDLRRSITLALLHEMRTPLTTIIGYADVLTESTEAFAPDQLREMGKGIRHAGERLYQLIGRFLLYAELELTACAPEQIQGLRENQVASAAMVIEALALEKARQAGREADLKVEVQEG